MGGVIGETREIKTLVGIERPCPACGGQESRLKYSYRHQKTYDQSKAGYAYQAPGLAGPLVECHRCRCLYINPIEMAGYLIQDQTGWEENLAHLADSGNLADISVQADQDQVAAFMLEERPKRANARQAIQYLHKYIQPPGRLLDVGCSYGLFLDEARSHGWQVQGLEPTTMQAIFARGHFNLPVFTGTLRDAVFPADSFDVVTAFQVVEHMIDPSQDLAAIHRLLKPGGIALLEAPNAENWQVRLLGLRHRHFVLDHINFYSPRTLSGLLERTGFRVREVFYPARQIRFGHLLLWSGRYTGLAVRRAVERIASAAGLSELILTINTGDIFAVIADKTNIQPTSEEAGTVVPEANRHSPEDLTC